MRKFWLSIVGGVISGLIISLIAFQNEPLIISYQKKYPEDTYTVSGLNFELIVDSGRMMVISFVIIFVGWILIEKLINKTGKRDV
ncbi:hypothetical protein [Lentibacillus sp. CBA3610]|uniref:hypothetical protein n=1 Tax=Lentibacillus sp. CBA3610 TaxID=2518176 RepID=UPI0015960768|nr:hypothetical protein [Lentibacillus sp. CBA3610]QKY69733.1 hypothetical protein Len3610_09090 [Lentibacillus sp. CBA3610]